MKLTFHKSPRFLAVKVFGDLDLSTAAEFRDRVDAEVRRTGLLNLIVSLRNVEFIDSTGIAAILGRHKTISALGGRMALIEVPERIASMLDLAGTGRLLERFGDLEQALAGMGLAEKAEEVSPGDQ